MKHYADNDKKKTPPRYSQKPSGGKRYASDSKGQRHAGERYEKKPQHDSGRRYADESAQNVSQAVSRIVSERKTATSGDPVRHRDNEPTRIYSAKSAAEGKKTAAPPRTDAADKKPAQSKKRAPKKPRTEVPATPTAPKPATPLGYAPAILFLVFIFAMAIWFFAGPKSDFSAMEKRYLSKFPDTSAESVFSGKFGSEFKQYFADHFPVRDLWVGISAYTSLAEGNNGVKGVYNCSDGYLINEPVPTENNLNKNLGILAEFKQTVGDVPMTVLFAPSTGYIAADKLPLVHNSYNDDAYFATASDTLKQSGIGFVDVREAFKNAYAGGSQLYYRTDHHWTTEGAYTAYEEYCKAVGLEAAARGKFNIEKYDGFYGTTYSTSGFWLTPPDTVEVWNNPDNTEDKISVSIYETPVKSSHSMFFYEHNDEADKYPIFLDGNHGWTEITNANAKGGTIVVIKDSFSHCFVPFLAENYKKVIMVDMRYYSQEVSQMVAYEKPEQILVLYGIDNFVTDTDLPNLW